MKNKNERLVASWALAVVALLLLGGLYISNVNKAPIETKTESTPTPENTPAPSVTPIEGYTTYLNTKYGFSFKYPKTWKIVNENVCYPAGNCNTEFNTGNTKLQVNFYVNETTSTTSAAAIRKGELAIINGHYVTPEFGAETDYSQEASRYEVSDFTNGNSVHIYQTIFTGKYTYVTRSYYFDTTKGGTIRVQASTELEVTKVGAGDTFYALFPEVKKLVESIEITK